MLGPFENGPLLNRAMVAPTIGNFIVLQLAIALRLYRNEYLKILPPPNPPQPNEQSNTFCLVIQLNI
jgi:hypothetical protein